MNEVHIAPYRVHHFLFAHSRHEEELKVKTLLRIVSSQELFEFLFVINFRLYFGVFRPVSTSHNSRYALSFEERHNFENLFQHERGDCFFSSFRNTVNLSMSRRSTSSRWVFDGWRDSLKWERAVVYALVSLAFSSVASLQGDLQSPSQSFLRAFLYPLPLRREEHPERQR